MFHVHCICEGYRAGWWSYVKCSHRWLGVLLPCRSDSGERGFLLFTPETEHNTCTTRLPQDIWVIWKMSESLWEDCVMVLMRIRLKITVVSANWAILPNSFFFSNVAWALFHWEWVTHFYLDTLDRGPSVSPGCPLMATLLKVAPCSISLTGCDVD